MQNIDTPRCGRCEASQGNFALLQGRCAWSTSTSFGCHGRVHTQKRGCLEMRLGGGIGLAALEIAKLAPQVKVVVQDRAPVVKHARQVRFKFVSDARQRVDANVFVDNGRSNARSSALDSAITRARLHTVSNQTSVRSVLQLHDLSKRSVVLVMHGGIEQ